MSTFRNATYNTGFSFKLNIKGLEIYDMKFICIIGDSAVGKMTVGQELEKITNLTLFHNHMTIELVLELFKDFHVPAIEALRHAIFEAYTKTDLPGLIFTLQLAFDKSEDLKYLENLIEYFESKDINAYIVELDASLEARLKRNKTENRLKHKASKRDVELSETRLLNDYNTHRGISKPGEIKHKNFYKVNNTHLEPAVVAKMIKNYFKL